jgi:tRNA A64-2'-O-ribosylphosphate transferase
MRALAPSSDEDDDNDYGDVAVVDSDAAAFASMSDESINASLAPSIYALTRALKRASLGVFHCVHSVAMDAAFVAEQRRRFSSVPMFANLRAGAWYVDEDVRECYFKSTDGHFGNWQFSATRLNAHVAREAVRAGGCVIVDATRSSVKRFPDALAKTIPIWADTWNRAREAALTRRDGRETDWLRTSSAANGPHLPDWISTNEQNSIRAKIREYASVLDALDVDVLEVTESLAKPFRCVWISQAECGLEFALQDAKRDGYTPIILLTASAPLHWRGERRASANGTSFAYIPGAGDDEESWAGGLTPAMFRAHKDALLDACERDIGSTIARIVEGRVNAPRKLDPRARFAAKGCEVDAEVAERISQQSGYIREGAARRLAVECGLGECFIASSAVYDRQDVAEVADSFLHVGELKAPSAETLRSFMHARAQKVKLDRAGLTKILPSAIKFASEAVRNGERLCITCDDGVDHSVAVAVAASMTLTREDPSTATKDDVRRRLALVSQTHPDARPTRGSLKQVYNYLIGELADDPEAKGEQT